jgi:hypothetical protein
MEHTTTDTVPTQTSDAQPSQEAKQLAAVNAAAKHAKKTFAEDTYFGIKDTFLGEELANCGVYNNPAFFRKRGLLIMSVAYTSGLTEVIAMKRSDPRFVFSTGPVRCDQVHLIRASSRWQSKQLLVVPVDDGCALCIGYYSKITKAFSELEYYFPMARVEKARAALCYSLMRAEEDKRSGSSTRTISIGLVDVGKCANPRHNHDHEGLSGDGAESRQQGLAGIRKCDDSRHNHNHEGLSGARTEARARTLGDFRELMATIHAMSLVESMMKDAREGSDASKDSKPSETPDASKTASKAKSTDDTDSTDAW